jgi:phosphatidylserine synthase
VFYSPARVDDPIAGGLVAVMVATVAVLMVSKVRYRSFKEIELKSRIRWIMVSLMALVYLLVATSPRIVLLVLSFSYLLSGLFPRLTPLARQEPHAARAGGRHAGR